MKIYQQLVCGFIALVWFSFNACAQTTPDMVVTPDGSGDFMTIQAAIDAAPSNSDRRTIILIKRGVYDTEKLIVPAGKNNISLIGESRDETVISYHIYDCPTGKCPKEDAEKWSGDNIRTSATLTVLAEGFRAENLTIQNTAGPVGQAQAVTIRGDKTAFINCTLTGYQDTMYFWGSGKRSYFEDCLILGRTDYIYGDGMVWFENCEIRSYGGGWITAPSTPENQAYGFIFNHCDLTYADNSPRNGDDGQTIALGRPWHEFPKVLWMNSEMTEMINPLGWPTIWNMEYAPTDDRLELYEYNNSGPGSDMSGRADWVGIRELSEEEANAYTLANVFGDWDPTAEAPLVKTYLWTGAGDNDNWLLADNWDPEGDETSGTPAPGESAEIDGDFTAIAEGETFDADLALKNGAALSIAASSAVTYLAIADAEIHADAETSLDGKIATKGPGTFLISPTGDLTLNATITGVHDLTKAGEGVLTITSENIDYSGKWLVKNGTLEAVSANSLGKGAVEVSAGAVLQIDDENALQPTSQLRVEDGAGLELGATVTLSEFFINDEMQPLGEYTAVTNPELISGEGKVVVGRPSQFVFIGGENGNWDNPAHFSPALMPEAGETVILEREMETTSTIFPANIIINSPGKIRLRGTHQANGEITMNDGTALSYATGGTGFTLDAALIVAGDIRLELNSGNEAGSVMSLPGVIKGEGRVTAQNTRDQANRGAVQLAGDNSDFTGIWDLTMASRNAGGITAIEGLSANAFGGGAIQVAAGNEVIFSHEKAAGDELVLDVEENGKAVLNAHVKLSSLILNGEDMEDGKYDSSTHPEIFEGEGSLLVGDVALSSDASLKELKVNGEPVPDFDPATFTYDVVLPADAAEAVLSAAATHAGASVSGADEPVDLSSGSATAELVVTAEDGTTATYTINLTAKPLAVRNDASPNGTFYPNPATTELSFVSVKPLRSVEIYSLVGELVKIAYPSGANATIDIAGLKKGVYVVKALKDDLSYRVGKLIKK